MEKKKIIRIVCAVGTAISVFALTRFLGILTIRDALGNTSYAINAPLMLPLEILASLIAAWLFVPAKSHEVEYEEDDYTEELEDISDAEIVNLPELDESSYPELFQSKEEEKEESAFNRPDISRIIREQGGQVDAPSLPEEKEDILGSIKELKAETPSIYDELPDTLPEDYTPYEYEEEDYEDGESEEEEYEISKIPPLAIKLPALLISCWLAIVLPLNASTIYSPDTVTVKRPFSQREYVITDAEYYTVGVKLNGDVSMKLHFENGHEEELIIPQTVMKSDIFKSSFSSEYGYAAFCNRLLKRSEVEKRFDSLTSLSPTPATSDDDIAYIEEITETKINY